MERSRVTVEYSHLPGQVFEHEANGVYCLTRDISGPTPEDVKLGQVLEALENALELWSAAGGVHAGFPPGVPDHEDEFRLIIPRYVEFDVWPAMLFCGNRRCGHVLRVARAEDLPPRQRCVVCGLAAYQQLPYFQVHSCGAQRELLIPACPEHPHGPVGFEDSASFYTAGFRCLSCRRPLNVEFRTCPCRLEWRGGGDPSERAQTPVTARDTRAFFGHHLTMVSVGGPRLTDAMRSPRGMHYALGHYAGTVTELSGLDDEARGRRRPADERGTEALRLLRDRDPDLPEDILAALTRAVQGSRGDEPALEATERLLSPGTLDNARMDRRVMERAFLFAESAVDKLSGIADRMRQAGHAALADRIDDGLVSAAREGIAQISVVRDFPVALVGYGYTREYGTPGRARLAPLPHGDGARLPLITVEARTEGLLVELDPLLLWRWCAANGWTTLPPATVTTEQASGWLLDQMYAQPGNGSRHRDPACHSRLQPPADACPGLPLQLLIELSRRVPSRTPGQHTGLRSEIHQLQPRWLDRAGRAAPAEMGGICNRERLVVRTRPGVPVRTRRVPQMPGRRVRLRTIQQRAGPWLSRRRRPARHPRRLPVHRPASRLR